jgi:hypothetical protein
MLCALNLDREQLPRDRMGLYGAALDLLLETRDSKRNIPSFRTIPLEHDQKIRILQDLAWQLSTSNRVELPKPVVERMIQEKLRSMPRVSAKAADVLDFLLERSGVLREPVPGRVDFVHRTVQEYLAAKQAADLGEIELLVTYALRDAWRETVIMAAGHANEPLRRDLIAGLLARIHTESRHARRLKLLVIACLETLPSIPRDLNVAIDRCLDDLIPPRDLRSARSLATAGEPVLSRLPKTLDGLSEAAARAAVRTAWLINGPEALDLLSRYAADLRPQVWEEVNDAWAYFEPNEYAQRALIEPIRADCRLKVSTFGQFAALSGLPPISRLWLDNVIRSDLNFLDRYAKSLTELTVFAGRAIADLSAIATLSKLDFIQLNIPEMSNIDFLELVPPLRVIWLLRCEDIVDYSPLSRHTSLRLLSLNGAQALMGLDLLPLLQSVTSLDISKSRLDCGLEALALAAPRLRWLHVRGCSWVDDLSPLSRLPLDTLSIRHCSTVEDVSPLGSLHRLTHLFLSGTRIDNIGPLTGLRRLEVLDLEGCVGVFDISPLAAVSSLRSLNLRDVAPGIDLTPLAGNKRIRVYIKPGQEVRGTEKLGRRLRTESP